MNDNLFESLLFQDESESLDFKRDQYQFEKVNDITKSELLKDILAFANSWRHTDAYILIGVDEVKGGKSKVVGVDYHLLNRNLQQFIDSKINRPLRFSYQEYKYNGYDVGIIKVPSQERPFYLLKNYGRLKAKKVYIRRGDTTSTADPDEIALMGKSLIPQPNKEPDLEIQFANLKTKKILGSSIKVDCQKFIIKDFSSIPDYGKRINSNFLTSPSFHNNDYYRDIAKFLSETYHLFECGLVISNNSDVLAENVSVIIQIKDQNGIKLFDEQNFPTKPSESKLAVTNIRSAFQNRSTPSIDINKHGNIWYLKCDFGNIQPGAEIWSGESFYIGALKNYVANLNTKIVANNLKEPYKLTLNIAFEATINEIEFHQILDSLKQIES